MGKYWPRTITLWLDVSQSSPVLPMLSIFVHEHLDFYVLVHLNYQQDSLLHATNGPFLAVIISSKSVTMVKIETSCVTLDSYLKLKYVQFNLHFSFLFLKFHNFLSKVLLECFSISSNKLHLRLQGKRRINSDTQLKLKFYLSALTITGNRLMFTHIRNTPKSTLHLQIYSLWPCDLSIWISQINN